MVATIFTRIKMKSDAENFTHISDHESGTTESMLEWRSCIAEALIA